MMKYKTFDSKLRDQCAVAPSAQCSSILEIFCFGIQKVKGRAGACSGVGRSGKDNMEGGGSKVESSPEIG